MQYRPELNYVAHWSGLAISQTRAAMLFGRALEQALAAYFTGNDWKGRWHQEWWAVPELQARTPRGTV